MSKPKQKRGDKLQKEMRKVRAVMKRLGLPRHRMHWLERLHRNQRPLYTELQQLCARFASTHRDSDPLHALYRFQEGRFYALPPGGPCLLDAQGQPLTKQLDRKALKKQCHDAPPELDSAQRLFLLYEKCAALHGPQTREAPTACLLTLEPGKRRAYYTTSAKSERRWGPVMVLREPERDAATNLTQLEQTLTRLQALVKAASEKPAKRKRASDKDARKALRRLQSTRVLVLDRLDEDDDEENAADEETLGSQDSFSRDDDDAAEATSDEEDEEVYFVESGDEEEEEDICDSDDDDDDEEEEEEGDYECDDTTTTGSSSQ